jgi:cysteinyl-tRNA synthetase
MDAMNIKRADIYPRATEEVDTIIKIVEGLIANGHAYVADGDVYFRITSWPRYGELSGRSLESMMAGSRVEIDPRKEHPMDFAVWKATKPGEPSWDSPWGPGRPGWHIECSAMSWKYLGEQIDIHGGGQDLIFPHHENELAQSQAYTEVFPFVKYWLHNGLLQLGGEKMSKSLGNLVSVQQALQQYSADALRLFVLSSYYRSPITYSDDVIAASEKGVERMRAAVAPVATPPKPGDEAVVSALHEASQKAKTAFIEAMDDDFGSPAAIAELYTLVKEINRFREQGVGGAALQEAQDTLRELAGILGFTLKEVESEEGLAANPFIDLLIEIRQDLRKAKQWALSDKIRDELAAKGIILEDRPDGTIWRRG